MPFRTTLSASEIKLLEHMFLEQNLLIPGHYMISSGPSGESSGNLMQIKRAHGDKPVLVALLTADIFM